MRVACRGWIKQNKKIKPLDSLNTAHCGIYHVNVNTSCSSFSWFDRSWCLNQARDQPQGQDNSPPPPHCLYFTLMSTRKEDKRLFLPERTSRSMVEKPAAFDNDDEIEAAEASSNF